MTSSPARRSSVSYGHSRRTISSSKRRLTRVSHTRAEHYKTCVYFSLHLEAICSTASFASRAALTFSQTRTSRTPCISLRHPHNPRLSHSFVSMINAGYDVGNQTAPLPSPRWSPLSISVRVSPCLHSAHNAARRGSSRAVTRFMRRALGDSGYLFSACLDRCRELQIKVPRRTRSLQRRED